MQEKMGLVAGNKKLPLEFCKIYKKKFPQSKIYSACIEGDTSAAINRLADSTFWVNLGSLERIVEFFKRNEIREVVFLGQITPLRLFKERENFSPLLKELLSGLQDLRPDSIFRSLASFLRKEGLDVIDSRSHLQELLAPEGVFSKRKPTDFEMKDIEFGKAIVARLTEVDIGQTVVVKNKIILSLEGFEGTDQTIKRAGRFSRFLKGGVVLKAAGKHQDMRFDVPVVGERTLKVAKKSGLSCLGLEAKKTFILEREKFIDLANKLDIALLGFRF